MHLSQAELDLYAYLSPARRAEIDAYFAALEYGDEDPDESANDEIDLGEEGDVLRSHEEPHFELDEDRLRDQEQDR